jgi:hypothetical protein
MSASNLRGVLKSLGGRMTAISLIDGEKWLGTVRAFAHTGPVWRRAASSGYKRQDLAGSRGHFTPAGSVLASA